MKKRGALAALIGAPLAALLAFAALIVLKRPQLLRPDAVQQAQAPVTPPGILRLRTLSRFFRRYGWAILPLIVVNTLLLHGNLYYNKFYSYDMPQHFANMYTVMTTGTMPPPPLEAWNYEAHQAPLYYILTAWVARAGDIFTDDGFEHFMPAATALMYFGWSLLTTACVQTALPRAPAVIRQLTLSVVMLFPMCVLAGAMYGNDLPVIALSVGAIFTLWNLTRSGHQLDPAAWLRAAALVGLAGAFKNNGVVVVALYAALAACMALSYCMRRRWSLAGRVAQLAVVGLPLALTPWVLNAWHAARYGGDLLGPTTPSVEVMYGIPARFFTTFDTSIFEMPFGFGPGEGSYWSLQYVTLHNDYYNHWNSRYYDQLPENEAIYFGRRQPISLWRFRSAVLLQYMAIPITLVMVFGFGYALYRLIRRPRRAWREGTLVVVLLTVIAQAAQVVRLGASPDARLVSMIHARYTGFLYIVLFIVGIHALWNLLEHRDGWVFRLLKVALAAVMIVYVIIVFQMMWIPTMWSYGDLS